MFQSFILSGFQHSYIDLVLKSSSCNFLEIWTYLTAPKYFQFGMTIYIFWQYLVFIAKFNHVVKFHLIHENPWISHVK